MRKILLLTTGGTISSIESSNGLIPSDQNNLISTILNDNESIIDILPIMTLDSSNIQPEEWKIIAQAIYDNLSKYDGIIVTHGTDTMAYTSSMISFMVQNPNIPIVFTGSQLPLTHPLTDAIDNLKCAKAMALSGVPGVFIAFDRKILLGCRAVKAKTISFNAFQTINREPVGVVSSHGLNLDKIDDLIVLKDKFGEYHWTKIENIIYAFKGQFYTIRIECQTQFRTDFDDRSQAAAYFKTCKYPSVMFAMYDGKDVTSFIWKIIKKQFKNGTEENSILEISR